MAAVAYLDTHVAAWLFAGEVARLSTAARRVIEEADLLVQLPELLQEALGSLGVLPEVGCLALLLDGAGPRLLPRQVKGSPADR